MFARSTVICSFFCVILLSQFVSAHISTVALSGESSIGTAGGIYEVIDAGTLSESGAVAYTASLEVGVGGVTAFDNEGVWRFSESSSQLIARTGVGSVPGVASGDYLAFYAAAIDAAGDILLRADLDNVPANQSSGLWRYSTSGSTLLARTGSGGVPDLVPSANFSTLSTTPSVASNGDFSFRADLMIDGVSIFNDNNQGVWKYSGNSGTLIAREGSSGVPGVPSSTGFTNFSAPVMNSNDQVVMFGVINSPTGNFGIWQYSGASGELVARSSSGNVPGVVGANFVAFEDPIQNQFGEKVVKATIDTPGTGNFGIWSYTGTNGTLLLHDSIGGVPGNASAEIQSLDDPWINDHGQILVGGELVIGPGAVTSADARGLWFLDGSGSEVARSGSGGVPELPSANFETFESYSLNNSGQIALLATLESGVGGVDSTNDEGLWILNPQGTSELIAREGDLLAGNTIKSLDFIADRSSIDGFNNAGQLLFQATFTNDDTGLFLYRPLASDFNSDGGVDADDLASWQSAYGQTAAADANLDGETGNLDFLYWAREFGTNTPSSSLLATVPEPASTVLILTGMWFLSLHRQRRFRP